MQGPNNYVTAVKGILGFAASGATAVASWLQSLEMVVRIGSGCLSMLVAALTIRVLVRAWLKEK